MPSLTWAERTLCPIARRARAWCSARLRLVLAAFWIWVRGMGGRVQPLARRRDPAAMAARTGLRGCRLLLEVARNGPPDRREAKDPLLSTCRVQESGAWQGD